jgi:hypothetical protein
MFKKLLFLALLVPFLINAQEKLELPGETWVTTGCTDLSDCIKFYGGKVVNVLWILIVAGSIIAILYGAVQFLTAKEDQDRLKNGRKWVVNGVIAVVVATLAWLIINALLRTLGA